VKWQNSDGLLNQRILKVEVTQPDIISLKYIYYWLLPYIKKINDVTAATTVKHLSVKDLQKASGLLPDVKKQEKAAEILETIDQTIEKTEALIQKYQQIKQGLIHDLFTRGVTPDGKLRPTREQAPELYKETQIGWIPREWRVKEFGEWILIIDPNPSHRYPEEVQDGVPICSTENFLGTDEFDLNTSSLVGEQTFSEQNNRCHFKPDDVIFARKGKIGLARRYGDEKKVFSHTVVVLKPKTEDVVPTWLLWMARSDWLLKSIMVAMNTNLGVPTLGVGFIHQVRVPFPQPPEQSLIAQQLDTISQKIESENRYLEKLKMQKAGLMNDLLNGIVRIKSE